MLIHGFWPFFWDARLAENWHYQFSKQFWSGELYPRWLTGMNNGLGSPVFFYYPPLPYWITSLIDPLVPHDPAGWRALGISACLGLSLSGFGAFLWLRQLVNRIPALIAAVLFMLMPYHLAKDLYYHGVFAEFWAFAWVPFILYFVDRAFRRSHSALLGLSIVYAALILTHLPTTLIVSPFILCYAVLQWHLTKNRMGMLTVFDGLSLGVGLSAIYLIPAMTMQQHITMVEIRKFNYASSFFLTDINFKTFNLGGEYKEWLLGLLVATMFTALTAAFIARKSPDAPKPQIYFWTGVMLTSFFMMLPASSFVWKLFPILQIIQFPWRFSTVLCTAAAVLIAFGVHTLKRPLGILNSILLQAGYTSVIAWLYFTAAPILRLHISTEHKASSAMPDTVDAPEYRSTGLNFSREEVAQKLGGPSDELSMVINGDAKTVFSFPRHIQMTVNARENCVLRVRQFYFAGWTAFVDGRKAVTKSSQPDGLIETVIPPGTHVVKFVLLPLLPEKAGRILSGLSLVIASLLAARFWSTRRHALTKDVELVPEKIPDQAEPGR